MSHQRLFYFSISNKSVGILKVYTHFFSLFFTFPAFLISCFTNSLRIRSMSKKKRKKMYAQFTVLLLLGGGMLLCLTLGTLVSQKNQSSFLTRVSSMNSLNKKPKRLKNVSVFKEVFGIDHIGALPYQWFN